MMTRTIATSTSVTGVARRVGGTVGLFMIAAVAGALGLSVIPPMVSDVQAVVVTSGSMGPTVRPGDVLLVRRVHDPLRVGSIAVFRNATGSGLTTHRVVEVDPMGRYVTKGDANAGPDSTPVQPNHVIGSTILVVPLVGRPLVWIRQRDWTPLAVTTIVMLLAARLSRFARFSRSTSRVMPAADMAVPT